MIRNEKCMHPSLCHAIFNLKKIENFLRVIYNNNNRKINMDAFYYYDYCRYYYYDHVSDRYVMDDYPDL